MQILFEGHTLTTLMDHQAACDVIHAAGLVPPAAPFPATSACEFFKTATGKFAMVINQLAFSPKPSGRSPTIGCSVVIIETDTGDLECKRILEAYQKEFLSCGV